MRLTPAGKTLYRYLSNVMDTMTNGFYHAWEVQEGYRYILSISYPSGMDPNIAFQIANTFKEKNPSARIHFRLSRTLNQDLQDLLSYEVIILDQLAIIYNREDYVEIPIEGSSSGLIMVNRTADEEKMLHKKFISVAKAFADTLK